MPGHLMRFGVSLETELLKKFDSLNKKRHYTNRSEAIRDLIRRELVTEAWAGSSAEVIGTVTIVYDHHVGDLGRRLTVLQHDHTGEILTTTHVHLDRHNCLEVLIVRGPGDRVRDLANRIQSIRGVKHATLSMTTTGRELA